jgi:hypothetical protein
METALRPPSASVATRVTSYVPARVGWKLNVSPEPWNKGTRRPLAGFLNTFQA